MKATALFDSGATLSCISKHFYDRVRCIEPSMVINANAGPAIIVTSADDKLINLGQCRLCIKLGKKCSNTQELKKRPYTRPQLPKNVQNIARHNR